MAGTGQGTGARGRSSADDRLRVVTFNVKCGPSEDGPDHWNLRRGILLDALAELAPDVLAVQECFSFQGDEIKMRFPRLDRIGVGRYHAVPAPARPEESRSGEHCDIFYDSGRFEVVACGVFWHSDTPDAPASASWGNDLPRITTWAHIRSRGAKRAFAFFNTHFHWGEPYLTRATDLHCTRIPELAGGLPFMLVGDFNLPPDSPTHGRFIAPEPRGLDLRDAWEALGRPEKGAGTCHNFTGTPDTRIDWIMVNGGWLPVSIEKSLFHRGGRFPSDHFPVVADCQLKEEETA